jgi:hypothetical protein
LQRVRVLEKELASTSSRDLAQAKTTHILNQEIPEGTETEGVPKESNLSRSYNDPASAGSPIEHEITVDELATGAFNDVPEINIGYFGNTKLSTS